MRLSVRRLQACLLLILSTASLSATTPVLDAQILTVLGTIRPADIQAYDEKLVSFGTRNTLSDTESNTRGIGAARRWIKQELERCAAKSDGRMQVAFDAYTEPAGRLLKQPVEVVNVVATLQGTATPERVLVVSGHYDSRATDVMNGQIDAPGADDDASGTAAMMAMACAFAPYRWPATIVFMAVAGEEQGLWGATHWADTAAQAHRNIIGMITNDIIGTPVGDQGQRDDQQVRLFADGLSPLLQMIVAARKNQAPAGEAAQTAIAAIAQSGGGEDTPTSQLGRYLKEAGERYVPGFTVKLIGRRDRFLRGGDHLPFLERGYAAVRFSEPYENFAHQHQDIRVVDGTQYGDLSAFIDVPYITRVTQVNAAGLASLALAPAAPHEVGIEVTELTNDSTLRWQAPEDDDVAGYRIYWREAGATTWQHAEDVGNVTRYTLKGISKDNFVFGVSTLSKTGQASLAVFPKPVR
ncbi:MAG: M28 family metallopeptidase [Burkholderiales bacterium]|nr:M28 family metallopeptidase [Burkholderiales bacterium]